MNVSRLRAMHCYAATRHMRKFKRPALWCVAFAAPDTSLEAEAKQQRAVRDIVGMYCALSTLMPGTLGLLPLLLALRRAARSGGDACCVASRPLSSQVWA